MRSRNSLLIIAFVALVVLFPVNAGTILGAGSGANWWWIVGGLLFALPSTIVILELAERDGSPLRSLQKGGHLSHAGALGIWVAGTIATFSAAVASITFLGRAFNLNLPIVIQGVLAIALAALGVLAWRSRLWAPILLVGGVALGLVVLIALISLYPPGSNSPLVTSEPSTTSGIGGWTWLGVVVLALVGAHEPFQRASLRPVARKAVITGMLLVLLGYIVLTFVLARLFEGDLAKAQSFTALADMGARISPSMGNITALLVAIAFAATTVATGSAFRELGDDLGLPSASTLGVVVGAGLVCSVLLPLIAHGDDSGATASAESYAITQGTSALLWALGYFVLGVVALRVSANAVVRLAGVLTAILGLIGAAGVLQGSFTPALSTSAWVIWIVALSAAAIVLTWLGKKEVDHLHHEHAQPTT